MPVFKMGYRPYRGPVSRRPRALAVAWENVRPRLRWWVWLLTAALLLYPYVVFGVLVFLVTLSSSVFPAGDLRPAAAPTLAFDHTTGPDPGRVVGLVSGRSLGLFWELLADSATWSLIVPAIACAGVLASDRRTGALQIYFGRPVTRLDYLAGKLLTVSAFVALTTFLPCLLLWIECAAFSRDVHYVLATWTAPFAILAGSVAYALWTCGLVLSLSAVIRRPVFVGIVAIFLQLLLEALGPMLAETLEEKAWRVVSPVYALGGATAPIFGLDLPAWFPVPAAFGVALGVPVALLAFVWWRVRAVEVVT